MPKSPRAPAQAAARVTIDDQGSVGRMMRRGEAPLLNEDRSGGLEERLMPRTSANPRAIVRSAEPPAPHHAGGVRAFVHELFFVKTSRRHYARPYLHLPGQILETLLLGAIFIALGVSMADSYRSLDPVHEESHCWWQCCQPHSGRCSKDVCIKHKDDAGNSTSPVDEECATALGYKAFRDDATWFLLGLFTFEYLVRVWCCIEDTSLPSPKHSIRSRIAWMTRPMPVVDVLSLVPFYIERMGFAHMSPNFLRTIRLFRIFSVFRWERPLRAIGVMGAVVHKKREELGVTLFGALLIILILGSLMYACEAQENSEQFANIPVSLWWCVTCLSTVGYGDMVPHTWMGKIVGCLAAMTGVGMFAMPAGILGSGFLEVYEERKAERRRRRRREASAGRQQEGEEGGGGETKGRFRRLLR